MKIWKVIEELMINPDRKFRVVDNKNIRVYVEKSFRQKDGSVMENCIVIKNIRSGFTAPLCINDITREYEFEEYRDPVPWLKALAAWRKGKTIYCRVYDEVFTFNGNSRFLVDWNKDKALSKLMLEDGKWYIEN